MYVLGVCCLKFSVGIFLLRLAVTRLQRWILCLTMGISGVMSIMYFFVFVFQCYTPSYFWVQYMDPNAKGSCLNTDIIINSTYAYSAMSCLSDFTFCILPAFMVWRLNMNIRTKISVIILLGLSAMYVMPHMATNADKANTRTVLPQRQSLVSHTSAPWPISQTSCGRPPT